MAKYAYNVFTGRLDRLGDGGGGGGSITINPDNGLPIVGTNFNILGGQNNGATELAETYEVAGSLRIFPNTWETPYVVDPSATAGSKGTYQTIQAAINRANLDGANLNNQKKIYIRYGIYTEDLLIYQGIFLVGEAVTTAFGLIPTYTRIIGNHSLQESSAFRAKGIDFVNPSKTEDLFTNQGAVNFFNFDECILNNGQSTGVILSSDYQGNNWKDTVFAGNIFQVLINALPTFTGLLRGCEFPTNGKINLSGILTAYSCNLGQIIIDAGNIYLSETNITSDTSAILGGGSYLQLINCDFSCADQAVQFVGQIRMSNCAYVSDGNKIMYPEEGIDCIPTLAGQIMPVRVVSSDYSLVNGDHVIHVDTSGGGVILNLFNAEVPDKTIIIKDISGNASTNTIKIIGTIDGASEYDITTDYGSVTLQVKRDFNYTVLSFYQPNVTNISSFIDSTSAVSLTTATTANLTSISLPKGKWSISGMVLFAGSPTVSGPQQISISQVSATHGTLGDDSTQSAWLTANFNAGNVPLSTPTNVINLTTTTTVYLVCSGVFSGGTMNAYGRISAIKIG